jgi:hypothetical protein
VTIQVDRGEGGGGRRGAAKEGARVITSVRERVKPAVLLRMRARAKLLCVVSGLKSKSVLNLASGGLGRPEGCWFVCVCVSVYGCLCRRWLSVRVCVSVCV